MDGRLVAACGVGVADVPVGVPVVVTGAVPVVVTGAVPVVVTGEIGDGVELGPSLAEEGDDVLPLDPRLMTEMSRPTWLDVEV